MQRNLKKIFKKIFYAIIIVGLFQIIGITAIIFLYFNNITDEIQTKLNKEIYLHVQSKAMQQISIIDLFLKSQFDSYRSTIWRTNIQDDINQLSLSITKIYSYNKKKSIKQIRNEIFNFINRFNILSYNKLLIAIDKNGNLLAGHERYNLALNSNRDVLKKIYEQSRSLRSTYIEHTLSLQNGRRISLIGSAFYFQPLDLCIFYAFDQSKLYQKCRENVVFYFYLLSFKREFKKHYIVFMYDLDKKQFLYEVSYQIEPNIRKKILHLISDATRNIQQQIGQYFIVVKFYQPFHLKYAVVYDLKPDMKNLANQINHFKFIPQRISVYFILIILIFIILTIVAVLYYMQHISRLIFQINAQLNDALQNQKIFLATVSHEIRTPLNGILGFLKLLSTTQLNDEQKKFVNNSMISARQLLLLINDILDTSKIQAGELKIDEEEFDFNEAINEVIVSLSSKLHKNVKLKVALPDLQYTLIGDKKRIKQIFYNILSNAYKFTLQGTVEIGAKSVEEHQDGTITMLFYVKDSGIGIPEDKQNILFTPFMQVRTELHKKTGGTGLGLYISRKLASLMGGDIWFESNEGKGTTFYIQFLLKKGSPKARKSEGTYRSPAVPDNQANYNHLKILIAEDIKTNQILLKALLAKLFSITSVDVAENGKQAVEMALKNQYDLILMDLKMPTMDGLEATRILRQKGVKIPIYMLTADVYKETQDKSQEAGADGFLKKPLETDKLTEVLDRIARNRSKFAN